MTYHSNYNNIPDELKDLKQWCGFKIVQRGDKKTKIPINAYTGDLGKSNDQSTWADFQTALESIWRFQCDGIGFYFKPPFFGVDIDNIQEDISRYKNNDHEENIISEFVELLQSYTEYSVSGNGIHIICKGELPKGGRRKGNIEMYDSGRFFAMTGNIAAEYTRINEDEYNKINYLHNKYISSHEISKKYINTDHTGTTLSESEIINIAKKSKTGIRFSLFLDGGWEQVYSSQSEADMAFCNDLAFWTNRDIQKMDSIFRQSALFRPKWDEKRGGDTYGNTTLNKAISDCTNVFIPQQYNDEFNLYILEENTEEVKRKTFSYDDTGNAERLKYKYENVIRYSYTHRNWYFYNGKVWTLDNQGMIKKLADSVIEDMKTETLHMAEGTDEAEVKKAFTKHIRATRNSKGKTNMIKECEHLLPIQMEEFDQNKFLFNVQNGYIDLKTGELFEHDKDKFFTKISSIEYTENIDCPLWMNFLDRIFNGNQELINYIQRIVGYSLTGSTEEEQMYILYGKGRNGKSVFLDIISDLAGNYAMNVQAGALMARRNDGDSASGEIARLKSARLVTTNEPNEGAKFDEGLVKQLTGRDKVTARFLYQESFDFMPEFKIWMATNHKPIVRGTDDGIWRRLVIIPFNVQIPDNEVDKTLTYKLKGELKGILKWAVEGAMLWKREGLQEPECIREQRRNYREEMDIIENFLTETCIRNSHGKIQAKEIYKIYKDWAQENGHHIMSSTRFGREMSNKFQKVRSNGTYYIGLKLIESYEKPFFRLNY